MVRLAYKSITFNFIVPVSILATFIIQQLFLMQLIISEITIIWNIFSVLFLIYNFLIFIYFLSNSGKLFSFFELPLFFIFLYSFENWHVEKPAHDLPSRYLQNGVHSTMSSLFFWYKVDWCLCIFLIILFYFCPIRFVFDTKLASVA